MKDTINLKQKLIDIFPDVNRELPEDGTWCEECKGLGFINENDSFISSCMICQGKGFIVPDICPVCGNETNAPRYYITRECDSCRHKKEELEDYNRECNDFNKATKIAYDDYDGLFLINETVMSKDEFEEYLANEYENQTIDTIIPLYVFGVKKELALSFNLEDKMIDACENGYEDMADNLDLHSLANIQEQIDKWIEDQGDSAYNYLEDRTIVIDISQLLSKLTLNTSN